ncbi:beta strand repeat-containing protein [Winogradskyella sp.]|uniref:beta strand repeat-containing protein n=1 Tax=Winogradskyella sp. TaxID=1883156 RepID=UPI003AB2F4E4
MKKIYTLLFALVMTGLGFGQTTVSYDFSSGGAVSGFNEPSPGISLDANIGFSSFRNSGTSDPGIFSNQLRLYQNATKGGSIIIYASNGVTITNIVVNASSRMGDAGYTVDGGSQVNLSGGSTYTISGINATSQVEFFQRESGSGNRIYVDSFDVTYTSVASCTAPTIAATAFAESGVTTNSATLSWARGDGDNVIVIMKEGAAVDFSPSSETVYTANTTFGSGTELGTGNYVVYNGSSTSVAVTGLTQNETYHIAVYEYNDTDTCYIDTALTGNFTTLASTIVEFTGSSASVSEGVGTYDLEFSIANENATATSFDVVLTGGTGAASDINNYTTQTVTFPGGTSANQTVTLTITDDTDLEADETLTFEIQNVSGGDEATAGATNTFTLTITNNDVAPPITLPYSEDFSDCGAAEWTPYDEAGNDEWICSGGEYAINGFPGTNDTDWLISDFSIDFDAYSSVFIDVTTQERYGDTTNAAGEFELLYSTDYTGGDPTTATWTALTFDPNNTSSSSSLSTASVTSVDASSISGTAYLAFKYDMNFGGSAEDWRVQNIDIYEVSSSTTVAFVSASATVGEDVGTYDLEFSIANEDAVTDTTFDVVLTGGTGSAADIDNYTTQTVTFAGGTTANQTVTITVTDDLIDEGDETLIFEIQNVAGGDSAAVGLVDSFELTILASDTPIPAAGWQITSENTAFVIDFDTTVSEVNEGQFDGSGFTTSPSTGQLDSDAWASTGMADGSLNFGGSETSGDYAKGYDTGGTTSGGFYAFDTGSSNNSLGFQATSSDFTPGTITLRAQNQTGATVTAADIAYLVYVYNDAYRSTSFNFSYSTDDFSYTDVPALDLTSDASADGSPAWVSNSKSTSLTGLSIADGEYLYLRWSTDDVGGSGSRDEFALDDISINFNPVAPTTYTYTGTWSPSNPNGVATADDHIVIASGAAIIDTNTTANSVTVSPGASLTVNSSVTLTVNSTEGLLLNSTSTNYSSLILDGTIAGTVKYNRYVNYNDSVNGNDLISAPLSGQAFNTFIDNNPNIRANPSGPEVLFGGFDNNSSTDPFELWNDTDTTPLTAGKGYRSGITEGEASNLVTFEGTVHTSLVQIPINQGSESTLNLIGNPFPSYLDAQEFLSHNASLLDPSAVVIYGYNDSTDGTSAGDYTIISALLNTSMNIAPGQAFFVSSNTTGGNIEFTTSSSDMRLATGGDDFIAGRNSSVISNLKLNLSNTNANFITDIFFTQYSTQGLDPGYDASLLGGVAPAFALYSHLVEDNTDVPLAVQALGKTDYMNITIPLGVNANQGEQLIFSINETNLPNTVDIYLEDNVTNTSTLLNTSDYTLTPNVDLNGTGRFYLRVTDNSLSISDNSLDQLNIYNNQKDKTVVISGQLAETTTAKLYDIQGRTVSTSLLQNLNSLQTIDVSGLKAGVYVVQLVNGSQNKTQKIIIR